MLTWMIAGWLALVSADKTAYKAKTVIDFSDVTVHAELTRPAGSYLNSKKRVKFRSLIRSRGDFRPELVRSLDQI